MISTPCPACSADLRVPEQSVGKKVMCKACRRFVTVPGEPKPAPEGRARASAPRAAPPRGGAVALPYRRHHYGFAHGVLPSLARDAPELFLQMVAEEGGGGLRKAWEVAGQGLPPAERVAPTGLAAFTEMVGESAMIAVIQLPPPEQPAEAWFVAGVYVHGQRRGPLRKQSETRFRLLTLERTISLGGAGPATVLGEWAPAARGGFDHLNHGPGPAPERGAFLAAVAATCGLT